MIEKKKISICFFGITRDLDKTFPSIERNIIYPATKYADVKVFCHFYDLKEIDNIRSQEKNKITNKNWYLFKAHKLVSEKPNDIFKNYSLDNIKKFGDDYNDHYKSIRNLIHQLFSLKKVYELSKSNSADLTIFVRPDLYYWDSFEKNIRNLINISKDYIAIPNWQFHKGFNDRFAICTSEYASSIYSNRIKEIDNYLIHNKRPLNAECLLFYAVSKSKAKTLLLDIKASRVRANGKMVSESFVMKKSDYIKIFITNQKNIVFIKILRFINKFFVINKVFFRKSLSFVINHKSK